MQCTNSQVGQKKKGVLNEGMEWNGMGFVGYNDVLHVISRNAKLESRKAESEAELGSSEKMS